MRHSEEPMRHLLDEAMTLHRRGQLDDAEKRYRTLLASEPDDPDVLHLLGVTLCQKGHRHEALASIDRAIGRKPDLAAFHAARGEILRELGRLDEAVDALEEALRLNPSLAVAHNNLGLVHLNAGRPDAALASFDESIRLRQGFTTAAVNRGEALQALERWGEAAECYREILAVDPDNAWVHTYLGHVLVEIGDIDRLDEAVDHCRRAVELDPASGRAHTNLGNVYAELGRLDEALVSYRRAVELDASLSFPWNNIGRLEQQFGRFEVAHDAFRRALELEPRSALFRANYAAFLRTRHRESDSLEQYEIALECDPSRAEVHQGLGETLLILDRRDEARASLEKAIQLRRMPAALIGLGRIFAEDGDFERSNALAREVLARMPKSPEAHFLLASNLRDKLPDADLEVMIGLLDREQFGDEGLASLNFGVATVLDARGRYDEAARYFASANARQSAVLARAGDVPNLSKNAEIVAEVIACFDTSFLQTVQGWGSPSRKPIFVVGMPRSGTTLVEQVLASHPDVHGAGERNDVHRLVGDMSAPSHLPRDIVKALIAMGRPSFRELADRHIDRLSELGGDAHHVVDKMPSNYLHLGLIAALWPGATVVVCRRDPRDVALSCWSNYFGALNWANDLSVIASQIREHDRLIAHWKSVLTTPLIEVDYENFVRDFATEARRLVERIDLRWDPACLNFHSLKRPVRTASLTQVRKPVYTKSVGRWRHYREALAPYFAVLAEGSPKAPEIIPHP